MPQALFFVSEKWPPYVWKPLTADYVAAGVFFFFRKMALILLKAAGSVVGVGVGCRLTINSYVKQSFIGPDGPSGQLATRHAS